MRKSSWLLLGTAFLLHAALLLGWRWQQPLIPYFFDSTVLSGGRGLDFYAVYQAGYNARHGRDIYEGDPARVAVVVPYFTPYRYLPIVAYTAGAGLSLLAPLAAYKLWVVVIELMLLGCVALAYRLTAREPNLFARLAAMWLVYTPYYLELFMGQFSLVQAALVWSMLALMLPARLASLTPAAASAGAASSQRLATRPVPSAFDALWVASVLWKLTTIFFVPVLLRLRRWHSLLGAALLVAATTIPYFLIYPAHWGDFVRNNTSRVAGHELGNLSFRQLVYEGLAAAGAAPWLQASAQVTVVVLALITALWVTWRSPRSGVVPALALWLCVFFLVSPQVWEHHYVMLLPALAGLYLWRRSRWVIIIWLLLAVPTPFGFIGLQPAIAANHALRAGALTPWWQPLLQHASKAIPALMLFGYATHAASRVCPGADL